MAGCQYRATIERCAGRVIAGEEIEKDPYPLLFLYSFRDTYPDV